MQPFPVCPHRHGDKWTLSGCCVRVTAFVNGNYPPIQSYIRHACTVNTDSIIVFAAEHCINLWPIIVKPSLQCVWAFIVIRGLRMEAVLMYAVYSQAVWQNWTVANAANDIRPHSLLLLATDAGLSALSTNYTPLCLRGKQEANMFPQWHNAHHTT